MSITTEWITIPGGSYVVGLTGDDVRALAATSAAAAKRRFDEDPDEGLDAWDALEKTTGNLEYLTTMLAAALPARTVTLAPFRIRRVPVTNGEWKEFMRATGAGEPDVWKSSNENLDRPVLGVSWHEATRFAQWANASLPEEDQWERAARGPHRTLFPWGNDWGEQGAWLERQHFYDAWPVDEYEELATSEGVRAIVTRRWEWTASAFEPRGDHDALVELYRGHRDDGRVRRGGTGSCVVACAAARMGSDPSWQADGTGFRLVRPA
jgi:formylglycine-generating enzyme required for sulfatase activity